ncbi:acyl-CoA dehydrogenase family protein (plasmid) [Microvirga sp. RSM25]|uniref:acyl-CoA dehydrogenase family protein n=1 Tax=Microvirga sp. RSM25 TaxID=3273802 RepID=UPI00384A735F
MTIVEFPVLLDRAQVLADRFSVSAAHHDETGAFPFSNVDQLYRADLLRLTASLENQGHGGGLAEAQAIVAEIARGEPSTALVLAMHYSHHNAISRSGKWPKHLVERISTANLQGAALINSAQVEPRIGSPSHGALPDTIARRDSNVWRITGHKTYATGIPGLRYVSVLAVTDELVPRLASFLVEADAPGLTIVETWNATGMRATASHDLILEDVEVPIADIIDPQPASEGLKRDENASAWYFLLIAAVYQGIARAAGNWILDFAITRAPGSLGQPLSTVPRIRDGIGEIEYRLAINERLLRTTAEDADAKQRLGIQPGLVKHQVIENAVAITTLALELGGNPGLRRSHPLERHHRDALCGRAHAPQNNLIREMAARAALSARAVGSPP